MSEINDHDRIVTLEARIGNLEANLQKDFSAVIEQMKGNAGRMEKLNENLATLNIAFAKITGFARTYQILITILLFALGVTLGYKAGA